jgi:hypothetical protein
VTNARKRRKQRFEARAVTSQKRQRFIWIAAGVVVALLLLGAVAWAALQSSQPAPGVAVAIQGQQHIDDGASHPPYNSDPPTSGWHYVEPADAGYYEEPLEDEQLIHNLEHGHVVISYDCSKLADCDAVKADLRDLVDRFDAWKIVAVPRENADAAIALTAWGRIDKLEVYDEDRIVRFVDSWRDEGPEDTPE